MQDIKRGVEEFLEWCEENRELDAPIDIDTALWPEEIMKNLIEREEKLIGAILKTLKDNGHLADGDNCTLIDLKLALRELGISEEV